MSISDKLDQLYAQEDAIKQAEQKKEEIKREAMQMVIDQYYAKLINNKDNLTDGDFLMIIEQVAKRSFEIGNK